MTMVLFTMRSFHEGVVSSENTDLLGPCLLLTFHEV